MYKKLGYLLILVSGIFLNAHGQEGNIPSLTLKEAQQYALDHNTEVNNATLDRLRAKKDVKETLAGGLPQINAEIQGQKNFDIRTNVISFRFPGSPEPQKSEVKFGTNYNLEASVTASQLIFDGTFFMGLRASKTYVDLSKKQFQQTKRNTKVKVAKAYYSSLVSGRNLEILQKNVKQVEQNLYETRQMYKNGFVEELDVDRLRLTLQNLENQVSKVRREHEVSRQLLKFQMGYPIKDSIILEDNLNTKLPDHQQKQVIPDSFNPENRLEFQTLDVREKLAHLNKKRYLAGYLPKLNAFATHLQNAQRNEFNFFESGHEWFPATYAGLSISIPIFDGFRKSAQIQKAKIDIEKIENQKENLKENIWLEVTRAKKNFNNALERARNQKDNLELARKIYNKTKTKYEEGVGSSLEVTTAQNELFQAQSNYINAVYEYLIAEIELKKALGQY